MNPCEAFNRINRAFGANRIELMPTPHCAATIKFELSNFGLFLIGIYGGDLICLEWSESSHQFLVDTESAIWLTAVANGLVRDDSGNMVAGEANYSSSRIHLQMMQNQIRLR